jgi:hypothetical protein
MLQQICAYLYTDKIILIRHLETLKVEPALYTDIGSKHLGSSCIRVELIRI